MSGPDPGAPVSVRTALPLSDDELAQRSTEFETASASRYVRWAVETFGKRLAIASSMADAVLIDLAARVAPGIEVLFIDTGYRFPRDAPDARGGAGPLRHRRHGAVGAPHRPAAVAEPARLLRSGQGRPARPRAGAL